MLCSRVTKCQARGGSVPVPAKVAAFGTVVERHFGLGVDAGSGPPRLAIRPDTRGGSYTLAFVLENLPRRW